MITTVRTSRTEPPRSNASGGVSLQEEPRVPEEVDVAGIQGLEPDLSSPR